MHKERPIYPTAYEWCVTDKFDPENAEHQEIKKKIELGDGLPDLDSTKDVIEALEKIGFEIVEAKDLAITDDVNPVPWYQPFLPSYTISGLRTTGVGIWLTHWMVTALEKVGLAPKGTVHTHSMLMTAHDGLGRGGKTEIFTPMFYFLVRKPAE